MVQIDQEHRTHYTSQTKAKRAKRKKQARQRLLILISIVFILGFLLGLLVGSKKDHTLNFIMEPNETETVSALNQDLLLHLPRVTHPYRDFHHYKEKNSP